MAPTSSSLSRVDGIDDAGALVARLVELFGIGEALRHETIEVGYEDCNIHVSTSASEQVMKVFASSRTDDEVARCIKILAAAIDAGVRHPALHRTERGELLVRDAITGARAILMERVDGASYFDLGRTPSVGELRDLLAQAARLHQVQIDLPPCDDPWSVPNLARTFHEVRPHLTRTDLALVEPVARAMEQVDLDALPQALVHGDLTKPNVMVHATTHEAFLIDFSVATYAPRIQDLAVVAANLLHDGRTSLSERAATAAAAYEEQARLTPVEHEVLPLYAAAAAAMELLGALRSLHLHGTDTDENRHWIELGRASLALGTISRRTKGSHGTTTSPSYRSPVRDRSRKPAHLADEDRAAGRGRPEQPAHRAVLDHPRRRPGGG